MVRLLGRCLPMICLSRKKRQSLPICEQQTTGAKHHQEAINKLFVRRVESIRVTQQGAAVKRLPIQTLNERPQPQPQHKKTKSKEVCNNNNNNNHDKVIKPDDTEFDCETHISDRRSKQKHRIKAKKKKPSVSSSMKQKSDDNNHSSHSQIPLEKLFNKSKKIKTRSPTPSSIVDIPEEDDHDDADSSLSSSMSSEWSTTTYPDSQSSEKSNDLMLNPIQRRQSMPLSNSTHRTDDTKHRSCVESFYLGREHVRPSSSPSQTKISLSKIKEEPKKNPNSQETKRHEMKPPTKSKQVLQNVRKMIQDQSVQEQHFNDTRQRESVRL